MIGGGANWPKGNVMVNDLEAGGVRIKPGSGEYRLCVQKDAECKKRSPAIGAGADGKNIGADVDAIEKTMAEII